MYVVFAEELHEGVSVGANTVQSLEQAFARIVCRCGLSYRFVPADDGWALKFMDVERPDRTPESVQSSYRRPQDAQHDLMTQAVDGRIRGHIALHTDVFVRTRIMRNARGTTAHVA
jgi:hypothetical protein